MPEKVLILILSVFLGSCCVQRHIEIHSDPPNAIVFVDGEKKGTTPMKVPFNFYGTREITLIKKGYHIATNFEKIEAPLYQQFPLDFFVEFLYPFPIVDSHKFEYTLKPYTPMDEKQKKELLNRAQQHDK